MIEKPGESRAFLLRVHEYVTIHSFARQVFKFRSIATSRGYRQGYQPMQQQYYDLFIRGTEYETKFKSQAEGQQLLDDVAALRRTLWEMRVILCHLEDALEEGADIKVEVSCLREQIEATAHRLALQLQTAKEDRT